MWVDLAGESRQPRLDQQPALLFQFFLGARAVQIFSGMATANNVVAPSAT